MRVGGTRSRTSQQTNNIRSPPSPRELPAKVGVGTKEPMIPPPNSGSASMRSSQNIFRHRSETARRAEAEAECEKEKRWQKEETFHREGLEE